MSSIYDVILDRNAEELLGAIGIAVGLAIAVSGVFALLRKRVEDKVLLVIVLLLLVSVASMGLGAGYVAMLKDRRPPGMVARGDMPPGPGMAVRRAGLMHRTLRRADTDGDGRISRSEASEAAASFLDGLDPQRAGSVDFATVSDAVWQDTDPMMLDRPDPFVDLDSRVGWAVSMLADADRNGRLEVDELQRFFAAADRDGDRELNVGEMRLVFRHLAPAMDGRSRDHGHGREHPNPSRYGTEAPAPRGPAPGPATAPPEPAPVAARAMPGPVPVAAQAMPGSGPQAGIDH